MINGFKQYFPTSPGTDSFDPPVSFSDFYALYLVENEINSVILKYILSVEKSFKSKLSYIIAEKYGVYSDFSSDDINTPGDYLYKENYISGRSRSNVLRGIKGSVIEGASRSLSVSYYLANHNHVPPWVAMNCIPLGKAIKLYQILNSSNKSFVAQGIVNTETLSLQDKKEFFQKSISILREYRNKFAHGERMYSMAISIKLPKRMVLTLTNQSITNSDYLNGIGNNDVFAVLLALTVLTRDNTRSFFLSEIAGVFDSAKQIHVNDKTALSFFKIPADTAEILRKIK